MFVYKYTNTSIKFQGQWRKKTLCFRAFKMLYVMRDSQCQYDGLKFLCLSFSFSFFDTKFKQWRIHSSPFNKIAHICIQSDVFFYLLSKILAERAQNNNIPNNVTILINMERKRQRSYNVFTQHYQLVFCIRVTSLETRSNMRQHSNTKSTNMHIHTYAHYNEKKVKAKLWCFGTCWSFILFIFPCRGKYAYFNTQHKFGQKLRRNFG